MKNIIRKITVLCLKLSNRYESELRSFTDQTNEKLDLQDLQRKLIQKSFWLHRINDDLLGIIKSIPNK
jgi:hypothetical protein